MTGTSFLLILVTGTPIFMLISSLPAVGAARGSGADGCGHHYFGAMGGFQDIHFYRDMDLCA